MTLSRIHFTTGKDSIGSISITIKYLNKFANKVYIAIHAYLQILQLMEDGPIGLGGLHAVLPVGEEFVKGAEGVPTHHHNLVERTAMVAIMKLIPAMTIHVLVSFLLTSVKMYETSFTFMLLTTWEKKAL